MQQAVETKANQISAAPDLLDSMDLQGKVTGDAMYTQRGLGEQIVAAGGHYLVVVKANQPNLLEARYRPFFSLVGSSSLPAQREAARSQQQLPGRREQGAQRVFGLAAPAQVIIEWRWHKGEGIVCIEPRYLVTGGGKRRAFVSTSQRVLGSSS